MTHRFSVWSPGQQRIVLEHRGARHEMRGEASGWRHVDVDAAQAGDDYAFSVDGGEPRPDPRSRFQPHGVHGPSRLDDPATFPWTDRAWRGFPLAEAVIYELHTGTFTEEGTFAAAAQRLDHLVRLGVNAVELLPVAAFPGTRGWGYDGAGLYAPHAAYGGPHGLRAFVDACHARGIAVVMDVVYNHIGPEGDYLPDFGPYFTDRYNTPWGNAVNYDGAESDEVRAFVLDNASMWLRDYHCDGLRLDAVHAIIDTSATHVLEDIVDRVRLLEQELDRRLWVIAESDANDPRVVRERARGGYGIDAQWSDNFHHALHAVLTGEHNGYYLDFGSLDDVCVALRQAFVYAGKYSRFRRRHFGRSTDGLPLTRFLGYSQNHDQVGNRAGGERLCHLVSEGRARIAAALTLLSPFVPMLFQGEEWAASTPFQYFTDLGDPGLRRAVSRGRRSEFADFGWDPKDVPDPQDVETFTRSRLRWAEVEEGPHAAMLGWYTQLIALRSELPQLHSGDRSLICTESDAETGLLLYRNGDLAVACNLGRGDLRVELGGAHLLLLSGAVTSNADVTTLGPDSMVVSRGR